MVVSEHHASRPHIITEHKVKVDGTMREYRCELVYRNGGLMIVAFRMGQGGSQASGIPVTITPGSISYGYFWKGKTYSLYRMKRPDGSIIAHRFDAVTGVQFGNHSVTYCDLVLDWWVLPDDSLIEEDRDELDELLANGLLSLRELHLAETAAGEVTSRYRHIIDGLPALERKAGITPPQ
jgi:hypothetical protein